MFPATEKQTIHPGIFLLVGLFLLLMFPGYMLRSDGGINLDTIEYARLAEQLPHPASNIFPFGYPLVLHSFHFLTGEYFLASKLINVFCFLIILSVSWRFRFFFEETVILLTFKIGSGLWPFSISEPLFLTLLYLQMIWMYRHFTDGIRPGILVAAGLMMAMIFVRHIGIFVLLGYAVAGLYLLVRQGTDAFRKFIGFYGFLGLSVFCTGLYLVISWQLFGSFFGENLRGSPDVLSSDAMVHHILLNLKGLLNGFNPFYTLVFQHSQTGAGTLLPNLVALTDVIWLMLVVWIFLKRFRPEKETLWSVFSVTGLVFLVLMFLSGMKAGIENLGPRLLAPGLFLLYFVFLVRLRTSFPALWPKIRLAGFASLLINLGFLIKTPVWYGDIKARAENFLAAHPKAQYFYVDEDSAPVSVYKIPFTKSRLEYQHPVLHSAYIHRTALLILKPEIKELDRPDSTLSQEQVILNSSVPSFYRLN